MKKLFLMSFAILLAFTACNKEDEGITGTLEETTWVLNSVNIKTPIGDLNTSDILESSPCIKSTEITFNKEEKIFKGKKFSGTNCDNVTDFIGTSYRREGNKLYLSIDNNEIETTINKLNGNSLVINAPLDSKIFSLFNLGGGSSMSMNGATVTIGFNKK